MLPHAARLNTLVQQMATRDAARPEATLQSQIHAFLLLAPLGLEEVDLRLITVESPAGQRRRIDIEVGCTVIEVKRDLREGNVREEAVEQLAGYVTARSEALGQRFVGVLTDGAVWELYHAVTDGQLQLVATLHLATREPDVDALSVWLEGVLATTSQILPTPQEIPRRLGATSPEHLLDFAELMDLYEAAKDVPGIRLKRELWAKLLTTAFGTSFSNEDALFVEHTLLVATAAVIAHALIGFVPGALEPASILSGQRFEEAQITGVVESDFFGWVLEAPGGLRFLRSLSRRVARFAWDRAEHDVMKVLYESVISADERHRLGEYYTPDWLAERMVEVTVEAPLTTRVLDPACGSGTFLFHAVRRFLRAAAEAAVPEGDAMTAATAHIVGVDVHPLAVTFARVTYLLAMGFERLRAPGRPPLAIPVYLGDSLQWARADLELMNVEQLSIATDEGGLFATSLDFPQGLLADADRFDRLVAELAERAAQRPAGGAVPSLSALFRRYGIRQEDQAVLQQTFGVMCMLCDQGRNHIWGYFVRNLARPAWLAQPDNRVDVLIGNPPWLAYRYMTPDMQAEYRTMSQARQLWAGGQVSTHQDLSDLFVVRCIELYLKAGGRFAFVMPLAALSRLQYAGFRDARYTPPGTEELRVTFDQAWSLDGVRPHPFPVPSSVVFGMRVIGNTPARALPREVLFWTGHTDERNASWQSVVDQMTLTPRNISAAEAEGGSTYTDRFAQGATIVPRFLFFVTAGPEAPIGLGGSRRSVRSKRFAQEKNPWRSLPDVQGAVEGEFIRPAYLGSDVLPYRVMTPNEAVIPWDGTRLLGEEESALDYYPGLGAWWHAVSQVWDQHKSSERMSLLGRLDYQRTLSQQFPISKQRVVYTASGTYLAAALIEDPRAVIEHKLYWATIDTLNEGLYLIAILNSEALRRLVEPLQSRGQFGPRDFDKYVFQVPIPLYDEDDPQHKQLAELAGEATAVANNEALPEGLGFQRLRQLIRNVLLEHGVGQQIEDAVGMLLTPR